MKKKFMMVALLLGTLMLGACVDDNETASVSAVREATAKQLKSVAAMNRAEAEATKALAEAEVALMQAKAAAQKASAEYNQAAAEKRKKQAELYELQKEGQSITNQQHQAWLEEELVKLEKKQLETQKELARIAAAMQVDEINAQKALIQAQEALLRAQQSLRVSEAALEEAKTAAEREAILAQQRALDGLASKYSTAVQLLLAAKSNYNDALSTLADYENELIDAQQKKEQDIVKKNNEIVEYQAKIEGYKAFVNYTEDLQALRNKKSELQVKQNLLKDDYYAAKRTYNDLLSSLRSNWRKSESYELNDSLSNKDKFSTFARYSYQDYGWGPFGWYYIGNVRHSTNLEVIIPIYTTYIAPANPALGPVASSLSTTPKVYKYESIQCTDNLGDSLAINYFPTMPDLRGAAEFQVEDKVASVKANIKNFKDQLTKLERLYEGTPTKADYPGETGTESCANLVDSTAFLKAKYEAETDATEKANWRTKYEYLLGLETRTKQDIESNNNDIENSEKYNEELLDQWDMLKNYATYQEELQKAMDKRNEMQVKECADAVAAWFDMKEKEAAWNEIQNEIDAIDAVLYGWNGSLAAGNVPEDGVVGIADWIDYYERQIETRKAEIDDLTGIEDKEELIAKQKEIIAVREAEVKVWEIWVAQTKADLDAALAKSEGAEE